MCTLLVMDEAQKDPDAVKTGLRIRKVREGFYPADSDAKLTLAGLSLRTGGLLSDRRISNYEQGIRLPRPSEALILARALRTSAAYLLAVAEEDDMNKQEIELLNAWRALPEKDRNDYRRRITALAMVYKEPVTDERVADNYATPAKPKAPKKPAGVAKAKAAAKKR